jgi:hypothetical protein
MPLPSAWDVDPRPSPPKKRDRQFDWMSVTNIRKAIFCLKVGDRARLPETISPQRLGLIVYHAKNVWPELNSREFEVVGDGFVIRRKA